MVKFINGVSNNSEVKTVMDMVNNYINYNDDSFLTVHAKPEIMQEVIEEYLHTIQGVNGAYVLGAYPQLISNGPFAKIKIFFKKCIRKTISWYIRDICMAQTEINASLVRALNEQLLVNQALEANIKALNCKISAFEHDIRNKKEL